MKAQLAHLEQTLDDVSKLEEQLEMKAAVENEQRGEIQVLKLRCEGLESQLAAARESWHLGAITLRRVLSSPALASKFELD